MRIYMYGHKNIGAWAYENAYNYIIDLLKFNVIDYNSTLWVDGENPTRGVWALTDRSSFITTYRPSQSGWARITRRSIRCAPSAPDSSKPDSSKEIHFSINIDDINFAYEPHITLVIAHSNFNHETKLVHDGKVDGSVKDIFTLNPFTIINPYKYSLNTTAIVSDYTKSHAFINGVAYMTQSVDMTTQKLVKDNIEAFQLPFTDHHKTFLQKSSINLAKFTESLREEHLQSLEDNNILDKLGATDLLYQSPEKIFSS